MLWNWLHFPSWGEEKREYVSEAGFFFICLGFWPPCLYKLSPLVILFAMSAVLWSHMHTSTANLSNPLPLVSLCLWSPGWHGCDTSMHRPYRQLSVSHKTINLHLHRCHLWQASAGHKQSAGCTEICHFNLACHTNRHLNLRKNLFFGEQKSK